MDIHKEFPKTVDRTDFWRQIKRTVNGEPVSEEAIQMIVDTVRGSLLKDHESVNLLDLGCGNGALAARLFESVESYTGVDFSEYLIGVAREFFNPPTVREYIVQDILSYLRAAPDHAQYTHVLCYGVMSYLPKIEIENFFSDIHDKFVDVQRVFIGNIPCKAKAHDFFTKRNVSSYDLDNHDSPIGVWWNPEELIDIANSVGWQAKAQWMPEEFYGAAYRFDLVLTRNG